MMDKFEKHDSKVFTEIMELPVDFFYNNMTCIITMSFDNLPETNSVDIESWNKFLADSWNQYFAQLDNIFDFLKDCVYHTCLAGRFYKTNSFLSLDDAVYLIKDRFHSADTALKTWHQLHKLARLILMGTCKESSSDASLVLDLHTRTDGVCVDSQDNQNISNLTYLPNEEERVLVFHITVRYNSYEDKFFITSSRNPSDLSSDFSHNSILNNPIEVLKASKSATSPNQTDSFSKSLNDLNDTGDWEKYGARPKNKLYFQKNNSDTTASLKKCEITDVENDVSRKLPIKRNITRRRAQSSDRNRVFLFSNGSSDFERIKEIIEEENHLNEACSKYQDISISEMPCSKKCTTKGNHLQESDSISGTENGRTFPEYRDSSYPSFSGVTKQTDSSFSDKEYCRHLTDTSAYELSPTKSDSFCPALFISLRSEDNSCYEKHGAKPKDIHWDFKYLGNKKECKSPDYFEKDATESAGHDLISPRSFVNTNGLRRMLHINEKLKEDMREAHKMYQEVVLSFPKSEGVDESSIYDSNINKPLAGSSRQEKYTSVAQEHISLKMPIIRFIENTETDDKSMKAKEVLKPDERENVLRLILKTFFENYKILDAPLEDNQSSGTTMTIKPVGELNSTFSAAGSELYRIPFADTKNSEQVNISEPSDQIRSLSFDNTKPGRFAIKTFDDKISFDWENVSNEKSLSMENQNSMFSAKKTENFEDNKVLTANEKQIPLEDTNDTYDSFLENFVEKLTKSPSKSPRYSGSLQISTHEEQISTPEKNSKDSDLLKFVHSDDEIKSLNCPKDDLLFDLCDESLELSDYSPESDSVETEDNDVTES